MNPETLPSQYPRRNGYITSLCIFLWLAAAAFVGLGVWAAARSASVYAGLAFAGALLMAAAGVGLFRMRRWGVAAFGVFVALGAVNHFSGAFQEVTKSTSVALALAGLNIIAAVLITIFMAYLVQLLWRNTK